ncbi:MAG: PCMD domain-containing protein [Rikenellaceae bacterium]
MKRVFDIRVALVAMISIFAGALTSCISNDIPYPEVELSITAITGEGVESSTINYNTRTVTLQLDEATDISNVVITDVSYTPEAELSTSIIGTFDMRTPLSVILSLYQDYEWTIVAEQSIERYFKVEGQIGAEEIDPENFTAKLYVTESTDLNNITIKELKLGPADITSYSPSIDQITQFESYRTIYVSYHSFEESWRLYVETTDVVVDISQCDAWAKRAYLTADGDSSGSCGFMYRIIGSDSWIEVSDEIVKSEGQFSTIVTGLTPATAYEFKAFSGDDESFEVSATTEPATALTNGDLEEWSQPDKAWFPYLDVSTRFWDTGNSGSTLIGEAYNLTTPSDDTCPGSIGSYSAQLKSTKVSVKFAAGNLFVGSFVKIAGISGGIVGFGQPFTERPTAVRGWMKYTCGTIDMVDETPPGETIVSGQTKDTGIIYAAVGTWTPEKYGISSYESDMLGTEQTPIIVDTRDKSTLFDPTSDSVISYGELIFTESQDEWVEFTIPLNYSSTSLIPTHIVIVASASRYGDYFTGSTQSVMWLDDIELLYE